MRVILDGQELAQAGSTLESALRAAIEGAGERLVIEATADGASVPMEHLENPPSDDPYAEKLEFVTADPVALLQVTMGEASDHLVTIREHQDAAADAIITGEVNEALPAIRDALEGWTSIRAAIELVINALAGSGVLDSQELLESSLAGLAQELAALRDALASQEWSSVADSLEGELAEQAEQWGEWFRAQRECLNG